ncbi:MAG: YqhA family protein [Chlorobiaceae bacterium]|nr:YqhA family protein [Chlorobiaceae bacterium]
MLKRLLSSSRYLVLIAVAGTFLAALTLLVFGGISVAQLIGDTIMHAEISTKTGKMLVLGFIEAIDLFLLGTVFFMISLGLYELFIDDSIPVPDWLEIHTLDDLKDKLVGVIVVVMGVVFLGHVIKWHGEQELLWLGGAIALVTASLTWFVSNKKKK